MSGVRSVFPSAPSPRRLTLARDAAEMSHSARPVINVGEPIRPGIVPANASHADFDVNIYASEVLDRSSIRHGWHAGMMTTSTTTTTTTNGSEKEEETDERHKKRMMYLPRELAEMIRMSKNSEALQELRRRVFEGVKQLRRSPPTGVREDEEYNHALRDEETTSWGAPELVHVSAEDVKGFFSALASDDALSSLERRAPHGVRKRKLFESLYEYRVPTHRAMWFVKINYLSQCRRDIEACRRLWTEDLISHVRELLRDENIALATSKTQSELQYVLGLGNYSIEQDLIDHKAYFGYFMRYFTEHKKFSKQSVSKASDVLHMLMSVLRAFIPEAAGSNANAITFVNNIYWCMKEVLNEEEVDGQLVKSASDVIGAVMTANVDAFVAAPRGQGVDVMVELQRAFEKKRRIKLSPRFCNALDQTTQRINVLKKSSDPKDISIHLSKLVRILHELIGLDEVHGREKMAEFVKKEINGDLAKKSLVEVTCDWVMDLSASDTAERQRAACVALGEVTASSIALVPEILGWIKRNSLILDENIMKTSLISGFVVEMIRRKVLMLQHLVDFVIANGIVEHQGVNSSPVLVERYRDFLAQALAHHESVGVDVEKQPIATTKQLLKSAEYVLQTVKSASALESPLPPSLSPPPTDLQGDTERQIFDVLYSAKPATMLSKLTELRAVHGELDSTGSAQKTLCRVIMMVLAKKPNQSSIIAELLCELNIEVAKAVLSYVSKDVLGVKNLKNAENIFCSSIWQQSTANERWIIARSVGQFQLCLLHGIPQGKRALAEEIIDADFAQLAELAAAKTNVSHTLMHFWLRLSTIMPLIGYIFMSVPASEKFSQLIFTVLDSFTGNSVIDASEEALAAESDAGESLVDRLVHLFSVVWMGQVPQWAPILPKLPYRETSSLKGSLERSLNATKIAAVVQMRIRRALGTSSMAPKFLTKKVDAWQTLESGTHAVETGVVAPKVGEKAAFWLEGAVRKPAGSLAWEIHNYKFSQEK